MKKIVIFFTIFISTQIFACSNNMQNYAFECDLQNNFIKIETEFKKLAINPYHLKGNFLAFATSDRLYNKYKNELLHNQEAPEIKNQVQGMLIVESLIKKTLNPFLTIDELNKYHSIFSSSNRKFFNFSVDKFRTLEGITNPKSNILCEDQMLNDAILNLITNYDLETSDGYPLIDIINVKNCDTGFYKTGDILFYKGPSVKIEMNRWLNEINDTVSRYRNNQIIEIAPYTYLYNMYRWFLAIHPYMDYNENVGKAVLIWAAYNLKLPYPLIFDQTYPFLINKDIFRTKSAEKLSKEVDFLSGCLFEYADLKVSDECREVNLQ